MHSTNRRSTRRQRHQTTLQPHNTHTTHTQDAQQYSHHAQTRSNHKQTICSNTDDRHDSAGRDADTGNATLTHDTQSHLSNTDTATHHRHSHTSQTQPHNTHKQTNRQCLERLTLLVVHSRSRLHKLVVKSSAQRNSEYTNTQSISQPCHLQLHSLLPLPLPTAHGQPGKRLYTTEQPNSSLASSA